MNNGLGIGLLLAFVTTIGSSLIPTQPLFTQSNHVFEIVSSLPLLLTTFGFSIVVPAVTEYLDYDEKSVKFSIMVGSLVALAAYVIWEWVTLGNIPRVGPLSFQTLQQTGDNGTGVIVALATYARNTWVVFSGRLFAIFAVVTSFLGVSVALRHFLSDSLKIDLAGKKRVIVSLLTYLPPLIVTQIYPRAFVQLLSFAGIFVAMLLGLFPLLMVYKASKKQSTCCWKWFVMGCVGLFFTGVIIQETINLYA